MFSWVQSGSACFLRANLVKKLFSNRLIFFSSGFLRLNRLCGATDVAGSEPSVRIAAAGAFGHGEAAGEDQ
jgi:hypothetical protein